MGQLVHEIWRFVHWKLFEQQKDACINIIRKFLPKHLSQITISSASSHLHVLSKRFVRGSWFFPDTRLGLSLIQVGLN